MPITSTSKIWDAVIIGGGPAGLSASIYLARFNRSVLVVDADEGRTGTHASNENYLGFPDGIKSKKLKERGVTQAKRLGVVFSEDSVVKIKKLKNVFKIKGLKNTFSSKNVVIATGVKDSYPSFPGIEKYIGKSIFWCIICDGKRTENKKLAVVGHDDAAAVIATRFLCYTKQITFLTNCDKGKDHLSEKALNKLAKAKIKILYGSILKVKGKNGLLKEIYFDNGEKVETDILFNKQGYVPNSDLAKDLNVVIEGEGFIKVDENQQTNIPWVYAVGDVTDTSSHQIVTAAHQGSIAGISINEELLLPFQKE